MCSEKCPNPMGLATLVLLTGNLRVEIRPDAAFI